MRVGQPVTSSEDLDPRELRALLEVLQRHRQSLPARAVLRRAELNSHLGALGFLLSNPSRTRFVRRWGPVGGVLVAGGLVYLWLWRARARVPSWEGVFTDPRIMLGTVAAVVVGILVSYWRTRYDWNERRGRLDAAREYAKKIADDQDRGVRTSP